MYSFVKSVSCSAKRRKTQDRGSSVLGVWCWACDMRGCDVTHAFSRTKSLLLDNFSLEIPNGGTGDSRGKSNMQSPLMDCKLQWRRLKQESRRPKGATGDGRGKSNSGAPYGLQMTMAETQTREPAPQGGNRRQPRQEQHTEPLMDCKLQWWRLSTSTVFLWSAEWAML